MIPKITHATIRAGLDAACPPADTLRYRIYCKRLQGVLALGDAMPCFAGMTEQGTLILIGFSKQEKPAVTYLSLLSLKKVRIFSAWGQYRVRLEFFSGHARKEIFLQLSERPRDAAFSSQTEQVEGFLKELRALL